MTSQNPAEGFWVATWGTAILTPTNEEEQIPVSPRLQGSTLRQQIRTSLGGKTLRLVISNEYGDRGLEIEKITVAKLLDPHSHEIDAATVSVLKLGGKGAFTVSAGERITTDPLDFEFSPLCDLAVTMELKNAPDSMQTLSCHTASRCHAWVTEGRHASDNDFEKTQVMTSWYYICGLHTLAEKDCGAIVCLGDSLTDGASVTTNGFSRYTDELARLLQNDPSLSRLGVVNMGIGATALYYYGGEIAGTVRANRDVFPIPGVKYCVLFMGVNDIGASHEDISQNIINEYKSVIERCRKNGIKIFGCTITPFKGNAYYSELHEKIRLEVNRFVLSDDSGFDGVIDLAATVASKDDSAQLERKYVSVWNDFLHFNDDGYKLIGQTVFNHIKDFIDREEKP